jgi:hypothetical protein
MDQFYHEFHQRYSADINKEYEATIDHLTNQVHQRLDDSVDRIVTKVDLLAKKLFESDAAEFLSQSQSLIVRLEKEVTELRQRVDVLESRLRKKCCPRRNVPLVLPDGSKISLND